MLRPVDYKLGDIVQTNRGTVLIVCEDNNSKRQFLIIAGDNPGARQYKGKLRLDWGVDRAESEVIGNIKQLGEGK